MKEYERLRSQANVLREQPLPHNDSWTKVKVFLDDFKQLLLTLLGCAIVEDGNGKRMGHSDGIRNLHHCERNFLHELQIKRTILSEQNAKYLANLPAQEHACTV